MKKNQLFFGIMLVLGLQLSLCATEQAGPSAGTLKVLTFNIDTNIGRIEGGTFGLSHPEWRVGARMGAICQSLLNLIKTYSPDVIHIQEGRKFLSKFGDMVDSITPVMDFLAAQGYQVSTEQYNPSEFAFSFITGIKKDFVIDGHETFYFTKTPDRPTDHTNHAARVKEIKEQNFGEEWERCVYITKFHDADGRRYRGMNVHLGMGPEHRKEACKMLQQDAQKVALEDPLILQFLTGDFNTFPDRGGPEQVEIMINGGTLKEATADLRLANGQKTTATFIAFPYDFAADDQRLNAQYLKETGKSLLANFEAMTLDARKQKVDELFRTECKALCGHLDRIFEHGFLGSSVLLLPTAQFADFDLNHFDDQHVKDFILRHHYDGPAFASDHQPLLATFTLPPVEKSNVSMARSILDEIIDNVQQFVNKLRK